MLTTTLNHYLALLLSQRTKKVLSKRINDNMDDDKYHDFCTPEKNFVSNPTTEIRNQ